MAIDALTQMITFWVSVGAMFVFLRLSEWFQEREGRVMKFLEFVFRWGANISAMLMMAVFIWFFFDTWTENESPGVAGEYNCHTSYDHQGAYSDCE